MLNRRLLMVQNHEGSILPPEYQRLEYIESTGTQYIRTGVTGGSIAEIEMAFQPTEQKTAWGFYLGTSASPPTLAKMVNIWSNNSIEIKWGETFGGSSYIPYQTQLISMKENKITFNGSLITDKMNNFGFGDVEWSVFASTEEGGPGYMRLLSLKMLKDGELFREFIPCYRREDGETGLFDRIEQKFYLNNGTGKFERGPEV